MKLLKGVLATALALLPIELMAQDLIKIGLFNRDAAIIAAVEKGFLKQENINVEINTVTDSPTLLRNLIKGNYDLILNNADNVIAWAEGQGEDPQKNDFVIFLGGSQGVDQKLVVDLRASTITRILKAKSWPLTRSPPAMRWSPWRS